MSINEIARDLFMSYIDVCDDENNDFIMENWNNG